MRSSRDIKFEILSEKFKSVEFSQTHCFTTASSIVQLMADKTRGEALEKYILKKRHLWPGDEKYPVSNEYEQLIKSLFSESLINEHVIFHIIIYPDMHGFIIEKESDGKQTGWRIYQSWLHQFTVSEWLGQQKKPPISELELLNELHQKYGQGKRLTTVEIQGFIASIFKYCCTHDRVNWYSRDEIGYIKTYHVNQELFLQNNSFSDLLETTSNTEEVKFHINMAISTPKSANVAASTDPIGLNAACLTARSSSEPESNNVTEPAQEISSENSTPLNVLRRAHVAANRNKPTQKFFDHVRATTESTVIKQSAHTRTSTRGLGN